MKDIKDYLEQTNTVLLTKDTFEYLKKRASAIDKIRAEIADIKDGCEHPNGILVKIKALEIIDKYIEQYKEDAE